MAAADTNSARHIRPLSVDVNEQRALDRYSHSHCQGEYKGQFGHVRGVNVTWDTAKLKKDAQVEGKMIGRRRGIALNVKLKTQQAGSSGVQVINYLSAVDAGSSKYLNQAYPVKEEDFYDYRPGVPNVRMVTDELDAVAPSTPMWSLEEQMATLTGMQIPLNPDPLDAVQRTSTLDPSEKAQEDALAAFVLEAQLEAEAEDAVIVTDQPSPQHWIVHPELVGLSIEAMIGANKTKYLSIARSATGKVVPRYRDGPTTVTMHNLTAVHIAC
ncbi:hypothetical protein V5O48_006471 [Marasmius crinis-equi]|uniref:Uncharacterized protein n=1 Tax=Marasmius crinis-equi TaxID=585013 RepID=A0ABR3FJE9_9AGAR